MVYAYLRVPTDKQDIEAFCDQRGYKVDQWLKGQHPIGETELKALYKGDTLICYSLFDDQESPLLWGALIADELHRDLTIVTVKENYVLRNDMGSGALVSLDGLARTLASQPTVCPHCGKSSNQGKRSASSPGESGAGVSVE